MEPFNGHNYCYSSVNLSSYSIGMDSEMKSKLTNLECVKTVKEILTSFFTISELEVWQVIFEK
jgi:hypothetical protein